MQSLKKVTQEEVSACRLSDESCEPGEQGKHFQEVAWYCH